MLVYEPFAARSVSNPGAALRSLAHKSVARSTRLSEIVSRMPEIAIVEDEPNILTSLRLNFRQWGYQVRTYSDPCVALPELVARPPDALILNGRMPGMHGLELYRRLRASSNVPVIFLSASAEAIADELARCGTPAAAYFDKPFWLSDLQNGGGVAPIHN